ncbi:MFS transporter [Frigoribacterium sp. CFBP 13712]|uniref:MFS transporter n=1 Tax=Frigoribacterium sp. CFBP 13712 TaxID=2775309 RepID=UPI00177D6021|nr:MFS transporter [Frigoribacterium sp. CFBP 13712]MBD8704822.1 MFS transporter [Frigoribacterium sp. CFBP 13712]
MSTTTSRPPVPRDIQRARWAVSLLFLTNGAIFANLLPRYPAIKDGLGLSNAEFGVAVAAFPLGAIVAGLAAGLLIRRFRSSRVAVVGTIITGLGVLTAGVAPSWALLAAGLFLAGAMDAITDVAQNSHGLRVQRRYGRSILNSFHAAWSVGAVIGGLMGGAAAGLGIPTPVHLSVSAALFCVVALLSYRSMLAGPEPTDESEAADAEASDTSAAGGRAAGTGAANAEATSTAAAEEARVESNPSVASVAAVAGRSALRFGTVAVLAALVLVSMGAAIVEDAGNTWAAVYLSGSLGASITIASLGFVSLAGMQLIGRLVGDVMVDRLGQRTVARIGGVLVAVGTGLALAFPSIPGTIIGFGAAGFGVATLIPGAMHAADQLPGFRRGTGLTLLSWLMRLGFLFSPPLVGLIADATSLRWGLLVMPAAGVIVLLLAGVLARRVPHGAAVHDPRA